MVSLNPNFPLPLPDDPKKWEGWSQYNSDNLYERLCLLPETLPTDEMIEEHCRELLRWWQKKLPLKNQPSNPIAQLLRTGLDEASRYLVEARVGLLDPKRRQQLDDQLAAQAHEAAVAEFYKYLKFALADGSLTTEEEKNLLRLGRVQGLYDEQILGFIESELRESGALRIQPVAEPTSEATPAGGGQQKRDPREEFMRMLRLSGLDSDGMTDDARDAFINMAENMELDPGDAEDIVDVYLEEADNLVSPSAVAAAAPIRPTSAPSAAEAPTPVIHRGVLPNFKNSLGGEMIFVPSGEFVMGSEEPDAGPNERPLTRVTLNRYFMSRFPITNAEFERFDRSHARKRASNAGDRHPVVHVSSEEAMKFCAWLSAAERKKYRLPTEAEWEYAARGNDGRKFPWGNEDRRADVANFADCNTPFAWSDRMIDDGYAESSPVGSFPRGLSPFKIEDMAGNVWEWCHDFFEPYRGSAKVNPRGAASGTKRVYRGGSWKSNFNSLRTTTRGSNVPSYSCHDLGFRVVCDCD